MSMSTEKYKAKAAERYKEADAKWQAHRDSHSRVPTQSYKDNWDRIFGKKKEK